MMPDDVFGGNAAAILQLSNVAIPSAAHHLIETLQSFIPFEPILECFMQSRQSFDQRNPGDISTSRWR